MKQSADIIIRVCDALEIINNEFGRQHPIRADFNVLEHGYDREDFHFEFGPVFGMAYGHDENNHPAVFLLVNDDNKWHLNPGTFGVCQCHPTWLQNIEHVAKRMIDYINQNYPNEIEKITI